MWKLQDVKLRAVSGKDYTLHSKMSFLSISHPILHFLTHKTAEDENEQTDFIKILNLYALQFKELKFSNFAAITTL